MKWIIYNVIIHTMNINRIDLNLLVVFEAMIIERNVTRAAQRLHLSQPALSNALTRLRQTLDDPLFVRGPGGMTPTPRAAELAMPISEILERLRQTLSGSIFDPATAQATYTLSTTDYVAFVLLPGIMERLRREAPGIRIAARIFGGNDPYEQLKSGQADLSIAFYPTRASGLHAEKLFDERFVVVARHGHPALQDGLTLEKFAAAPHALVSPQGGGFTGVVDQMLAEHGLRRNVVLSIQHFLAVPEIIAQTDLLVTLAERLASRFADSLPLEVLQPPLAIPGFSMSMVWHKRNHVDAGHRWLRQVISEASKSVG